MNTYRALLISWVLMGLVPLHAQISDGGVPLGVSDEAVALLLESPTMTTLELPALNNEEERNYADAILAAECANCRKQYYGTVLDLSANLTQDATEQQLADGGTVWLLRVLSPTAYALQFYFQEFDIPFGARLFVYNEDRSMILGAYTSDNNPQDVVADLKFAIEYIDGNSVILEYYEPEWADYNGSIIMAKAVHVFRDVFGRTSPSYGTSDPCNVNVACTTHTAGWEQEASSVALVQIIEENYDLAGTCSGAVVNSTDYSGIPYFLTASHCADGSASGQNYANYAVWVFKFGHQTKQCQPPLNHNYIYDGFSVVGASKVARQHTGGPQSDYLLLKLKTDHETLKKHKICYSGWMRATESDGEANGVVGIHHPEGDVKKFCKSTIRTTSTENGGTVPWTANDHIRVIDWTVGVTASGSSGSPLYNPEHMIVGQLHSGLSECVGDDADNGQSDWYGKMYDNFKDDDFRNALAPNNSIVTILPTHCLAPVDGLADKECETQLKNGMNLNGNADLDAIVCAATSILRLEPHGACEEAVWGWPKIVKKYRCNKIPSHLQHIPDIENDVFNYNCWVRYYTYKVSIVETDINKNIIGTQISKWFYTASSLADGVTLDNNTWTDMGVTLGYGKYYRVRLEGVIGGTQSAARFFRYLPVHIVKTGYVVSDLVAQLKVTLFDASVIPDVDVVAGKSIHIFEQTSLKAGTFKIEPQAFCDLQRSGLPISEDRPAPEDTPQEFLPGSDPNVNVYPNPSSGRISIDASGLGTSVNIELVNSLGQVQLQLQDARARTDIDLSSLPDGMYILRLNNGTTTLSRKVIKQ